MSLELFLGIAGFVCALAGGYWALARLVVAQFEKRLDERFATQETARREGRKAWEERFSSLDTNQRALDRDLLKLKADLPNEYVRREDWVRFGAVIEAKIDRLDTKVDMLKDRIHE